MKAISATYDIWKTSKDEAGYKASKNLRWFYNFNKIMLCISIQTGSAKKLHHLMHFVDHGKLISLIIKKFHLGANIKGITLQSDGKLILRKMNKSIEIEDFSQSSVYAKYSEEAIHSLNSLFNQLTTPQQTDPHPFISSISIDLVPEQTLTSKERRAIYKESLPWLIDFWEVLYLRFTNFFNRLTFFWRSKPEKLPAPVPVYTGKQGMHILLEHFRTKGTPPAAITKNWLQKTLPEWLRLYILSQYIPALALKDQDREELIARAKASRSNQTRKIYKTLPEKREEFEARISTHHPKCSFKHMNITTCDGAHLDTFVIFNQANGELYAQQQKWILFFNSADSAYENMLIPLCQIAEDSGANIYTGNYRGVGSSSGKPHQSKDFILDGETMLQHLLQSGVLPENILIHGFSMGGGIATEVAALHQGIHLCNDRSFTRLTDCLNELMPSGIKKYLNNLLVEQRWEFNSIDNLGDITGHILVIASTIGSTILGKAKLGHWVSGSTGYLKRKVIWVTERYLHEKDHSVRASRAHSDPITTTAKYPEYLSFVRNALRLD